MDALDRSALDASSLADLHAIADQIGLDGFRKLRKAELVDAIVIRAGGAESAEPTAGIQVPDTAEPERDRSDEPAGQASAERPSASRRRRSVRSRGRAATETGVERRAQTSRIRRNGREGSIERHDDEPVEEPRSSEGVIELLGNGSAFLRVDPPEPSDEDVYVSAAQVRRCELVSGDRVGGPVRAPRRSERYPSLLRIDTINGASADTVSEGVPYENLAVAYPSERLALGSEDPTLEAIEWLTPIGRGSRAVITGAARAGKTEALRRLLGVLAGKEDLDTTLVLIGVRPEEVPEWQLGALAPAAALTFAAGADSQGQAVERVVETAKRIAARGGDALVLLDSLDGLHPHVARRVLAAARNLATGGSLTIIATATRPFGGETTVIGLDATLTSTGRFPALDLLHSGTLRPELLVGEDGATAISQARAAAASGQPQSPS
jgi:transcription termination factor Rho